MCARSGCRGGGRPPLRGDLRQRAAGWAGSGGAPRRQQAHLREQGQELGRRAGSLRLARFVCWCLFFSVQALPLTYCVALAGHSTVCLSDLSGHLEMKAVPLTPGLRGDPMSCWGIEAHGHVDVSVAHPASIHLFLPHRNPVLPILPIPRFNNGSQLS